MPLRQNAAEETPILPERDKGDRHQDLCDMSQLATKAKSTVVAEHGDEAEGNIGSNANSWIDPNPPPYSYFKESIPIYPHLSASYQQPLTQAQRSALASTEPIVIHHKIILSSQLEDLGSEPGLVTCKRCNEMVRTQVSYKIGKSAILLSFVLCAVPLCVNKWKDTYHTCPKCEQLIIKITPC